MIKYVVMTLDQASKLKEIDRSETIDLLYEMREGKLTEVVANHVCPTWDDQFLRQIQERYSYELRQGGMAIGAFDGETLVGFGVLAHQFRGIFEDQLQVDLMYVSRSYRRQGIGTRIMKELGNEAMARGAKYLYISSTETRSAVSFYRSRGSQLTENVDQELYSKEPNDIHMLIELSPMPIIVDVRDKPELLNAAIDYFWNQWGNNTNAQFYRDCMERSCITPSDLPRFYLALEGDSIVGSCALLRSDLNSRQDLCPWFACLYVNPEDRGKSLGAQLQSHAIEQAGKKGYSSLYLCTDMSDYYEKYNWKHIGIGYSISDDETKIYEYLIK